MTDEVFLQLANPTYEPQVVFRTLRFVLQVLLHNPILCSILALQIFMVNGFSLG